MTGTPTDSAAPVRSRWRWMALWSVCCVVVLAVTFTLGSFVRSPWQHAIENSTAVPVVTAVVEERQLSVDAAVVVGTVSLGSTALVPPPGAADVEVVTGARKGQGETLRPGEALLDVSGRPLVALALPFRLYRDLTPGMPGAPGPDVAAVQQALADLGLYGGVIDGRYGQATVEAVAQLYAKASLTPPGPAAEAVSAAEAADDASADALAALTASQQEVTAAAAALDTARNARAGVSDPEDVADADAAVADAASRVADAAAARDAAGKGRDEARRAAATARLAASTPLPMAEVVRVPASGVTVVDIAAVGTELSGDGVSVAQVRSGEPAVTVRVGASEVGTFTPGVAVAVTGTTDTSRTVAGTVGAVGPFVATPAEGGAPPGYDVTVVLPPEQPFVQGQDVTVTVASAGPALEGLAVPLIAVREDSDGAYVLVEGRDADQQPRRIAVTVVGSADGYAVVTGDGLAVGGSVVVSDGT